MICLCFLGGTNFFLGGTQFIFSMMSSIVNTDLSTRLISLGNHVSDSTTDSFNMHQMYCG